MVKKWKKFIGIILMIILFINIFLLSNNRVYAAITDVTEWDGWKPTLEDPSALNDMVGPIVGAIRVIGILISVGTLSYIGIRTMLGSVEEKAAYKKSLIPWTLGAVMVFAISYIPGMIYDVTNDIGTTISEQQDEQNKPSKLEGFDDAVAITWDLLSKSAVDFGNANWNQKLTILSNIRQTVNDTALSTNRNKYYEDGLWHFYRKVYNYSNIPVTPEDKFKWYSNFTNGAIWMKNKIESNDITEENIEQTKNNAYTYYQQELSNGNIAGEAWYYGQYIRSSIQQDFWEGKF